MTRLHLLSAAVLVAAFTCACTTSGDKKTAEKPDPDSETKTAEKPDPERRPTIRIGDTAKARPAVAEGFDLKKAMKTLERLNDEVPGLLAARETQKSLDALHEMELRL